MREIARGFKVDFKLVTARDHAQSYGELDAGKADAFATDDVLLYGLVRERGAHKKYQEAGAAHRISTTCWASSYPTTPTASCSAKGTRSSPSWCNGPSMTSRRTARS